MKTSIEENSADSLLLINLDSLYDRKLIFTLTNIDMYGIM